MNCFRTFSLILLMAALICGCSSDKKHQAEIRRAYAAGEQAARAQMQQAQTQQAPIPQAAPAQQATSDPYVRVLGSVKNPMLMWSNGMSLARALVEAEYQKNTTPKAITIYRNNQPFNIDPQQVLQGADFPLFPGDIVYIQD